MIGRHSLPELLADLLERRLRIRLARVDLVDDDDAAEAAVAGRIHHALRHRLDAGDGAHDDGRGLDRLEDRQRAADEIRVTGRVDQVDVGIARLEPAVRGIDRMQQASRLGIVIADRRAPGQAPLRADAACTEQEGLGQQGLSRPGVTDQGQVSNVAGRFGHPVPRKSGSSRFFKKNSTEGPRWLAPSGGDGQTRETNRSRPCDRGRRGNSMAVSIKGDSADPMVEPNVIPLVDIMLVLLIIFIITIPVMTHAVKIDLPRDNPNQPLTEPGRRPHLRRVRRHDLLEWHARRPADLPRLRRGRERETDAAARGPRRRAPPRALRVRRERALHAAARRLAEGRLRSRRGCRPGRR